jgi:hypothetical protein
LSILLDVSKFCITLFSCTVSKSISISDTNQFHELSLQFLNHFRTYTRTRYFLIPPVVSGICAISKTVNMNELLYEMNELI